MGVGEVLDHGGALIQDATGAPPELEDVERLEAFHLAEVGAYEDGASDPLQKPIDRFGKGADRAAELRAFQLSLCDQLEEVELVLVPL